MGLSVTLLPLHRIINYNWGSELTEAFRFLIEISKIKELDITAVIGNADQKTIQLIPKRVNVINLSLKPGYNAISYLKFQKSIIKMAKELVSKSDVIHHFWPATALKSYSLVPILHPNIQKFVFGPILFPQQELLSVDSRVYAEKLGWNNSPLIDTYMRITSPLFSHLHKLSLEKCDHIFFDSNTTKDMILSKFHDISHVNTSVIPTSFVKVRNTPVEILEKDELVVGVLTYYRRTKHVDVLLKALSQIPCSKVKLLLAGEGPDIPILKELVHKLGLEERVKFLGHINNKQMENFRKSIDFIWSGAIFPFEGLPSIREMMANGVPAIGVSFKNKIEWLSHVVLVPPLDPIALSKVLNYLSENKSTLLKSMKAESLNFAKIQFDADTLMKRILKAYNN